MMGSGQPGSASQHIQRLFDEGSLAGLSDGQLLERYLARGDELAFEALVERHATMVLGVCRRSLDEPGDVDDAFQATFLVLARRSRAVRDRDVLGGWLFGVARRVCLLANRAASRRRRHERGAAERKEARESVVMDDDGRGATLYEEIDRLPSAYRLPVVLCLMEGRSRTEAAGQLRWTEGMVRGRLARARRLLRARLIRRGVAPAAALAALTRDANALDAVPKGWIEGAARAATGTRSAAAAALTGGVIRIMMLKKLTTSATALLGAILVAWAATAALVAHQVQDPPIGPRQAGIPAQPAPDAAVASASGTVPLEDPGKAALHGRVLAADGKPVAGAHVRANIADEKLLAEARTDAEGRFRLGPIGPLYRNRFDLIVEAPGFARLSIPRGPVFVFPGLDYDIGNIQVDRGRVFTGQVLDADGTPRTDATIAPEVFRNRRGHTVEEIGTGQTLTTDAEGRFRTPPLPVGHLGLKVRAPERQLAYISRPIRPGGEEDLGAIRLEKDIPVTGIVRDEEGKPIAGAAIIVTVEHVIHTDAEGKFTIRGFGPNTRFQMNVRKDGYTHIVGSVTVNEAGFRYRIPRVDTQPAPLTRELVVTMKRWPAGLIEGQAIDADTGKPVTLEKVRVLHFERMPDGEIVPQGGGTAFEQAEPGRFQASYFNPGEFRLTLSAAGYLDAEVYTPRVTELKTIGGVVVKIKKADPTTPTVAGRTITGTVTRDGRPVKAGWVGLWRIFRPSNAINAPVMRGRMVEDGSGGQGVPIRDGSYTLNVSYPGETWYVVVEEPGHALTQVGPIAIAPTGTKRLDIACTEGGRIRGRVGRVPPEWAGHLWVVAFNKTAVREEARVAPDGTFALPPLPAGDYGLKVGHDAFEDDDVHPGWDFRDRPEASKEMADPWKRAKVVTVEAGRDTSGVELALPQK